MATTLAPSSALERVEPDESALTAEFIAFLKEASAKRHPTGPVLRFNQGRDSGCVQAELIVRDDLPSELRVGLFAEPRSYKAWVRFANASSRSDLEKDVRGMSIKIYDVPGENLTPGVTTQDFVLNSHPVLVAGNPRDFLGLLRAMEAGGLKLALFFLSHPRSLRIGIAARANPASHLDISYWSTTPYLFGEGRAVKYVVRPCAPGAPAPPRPPGSSYLRDALRERLARSEACFDFLVQLQGDARAMPIEDATVEWKQEDSPHRPVARLRIPRQNLDEAGRAKHCEEVAFNPWHALVEHRPLGGINRARRDIYRAMAEFRAERRGG